MPATFIYLGAAFVLAVVALLLLAAAMLMALVPKLRSRARWIALGVPGSAVGLLAFQLAAFPIVLAILWTFLAPVAYFHGSGGVTTNPLIIWLSIGGLVVVTALFGTASLGGLVLGWRVANALGERIPLQAFLATDAIWQTFSTVFRRPFRLPFLLWLLCAWSVFGVSSVRCWLNSGVTVADVPGTYRATSPFQEPHVLDLKADGSWEYLLEKQLEGARVGRWAFEPDQSDSTAVAVSFEVEPGSQWEQPGAPLEKPGFVFSYISRDCGGRLRVCFGADDRICFEQMGETKRRSGRDIKSELSADFPALSNPL